MRMLARIAIAGSLLINVAGIGLGTKALMDRGGLNYIKHRFGFTTESRAETQAGYRYRLSVHNSMPVLENEVIFIGDSLTESYPWAEHYAGLPVRNFGIGSDKSADLVHRVDTITRRQPAQVFVMIGHNDFVGNPVPGVVQRNVREFVETIHTQSPSTEVVLFSVLPSRRSIYAPMITAGNERLAEVADELGIRFVDLYDRYVDDAGVLRDEFSVDGVHLTKLGYEIWISEIDQLIERMDYVTPMPTLVDRLDALDPGFVMVSN
ncbi:MAG: GDSL-type esterase/lipase family protein [Planctomycetota bacterium]